MAKEPDYDINDFNVAWREAYETGFREPTLVKKAIEIAKYIGAAITIEPIKPNSHSS